MRMRAAAMIAPGPRPEDEELNVSRRIIALFRFSLNAHLMKIETQEMRERDKS